MRRKQKYVKGFLYLFEDEQNILEKVQLFSCPADMPQTSTFSMEVDSAQGRSWKKKNNFKYASLNPIRLSCHKRLLG